MYGETKTCQNCKQEFRIEPEDFAFYEKMKVPAPTFCPECRTQRRFMFRNERNLYKRIDPISGKEFISMYSPDKPFTVYPHDYWWSDKWDPLGYGAGYDFSKPFFQQFKELMQKIPWSAMLNLNSVNSEYCNYSTNNKNCFLVFGGDFNENCHYSKFNFHSRDSTDLFWAEKCELCYENIDSENNYRVYFSQYAYNCRESAFLFDCTNCEYCIGCVGLRNKSHCIFNQQYSKEEYVQKAAELNVYSFKSISELARKFEEFKAGFPHRSAVIIKSTNSSGNNIYNAKNCARCFDVHDDTENCRDLLIAGWGVKEVQNCNHAGHGAELAYDSIGIFSGAYNAAFSLFVPGCRDVQYSFQCQNSSDIFGCIGVRAKQYCILNKQYTKEEYEVLVPKIKEHMQSMPYKDAKGRIYGYGEFLPPDLAPFAYNETIAQEDFPLTKEEILQQGYSWKEPETRNYKVTLEAKDLPDTITDVTESMINEIIECPHQGMCTEQCTTAFRITPQELVLYRKMNLPLPRFCPNCRHYARLAKRNPFRLWHRSCQCSGIQSDNTVYQNQTPHFHAAQHCPNEFETSYAPEKKEIVYCEQCYQAEIV